MSLTPNYYEAKKQRLKALEVAAQCNPKPPVRLAKGVTGEMLGANKNINKGAKTNKIKPKNATPFQTMIKPLLDEGIAPADIAETTMHTRAYIYTQISNIKKIYGAEWYAKVKAKRDDRKT